MMARGTVPRPDFLLANRASPGMEFMLSHDLATALVLCRALLAASVS